MQKKSIRRLLLFTTIPIFLFVVLVTFMTIYEYTFVAELRETFVEVDANNSLAYGKVLFETRGCSSCHAIKPEIESLGPNLSGISKMVTVEYIRESIVTPGAVLDPYYPDITMPNFGEILDTEQVDALVAYVSSL